MEIENAINNLSNPNEEIRIQARNICLQFSTFQHFDPTIFQKLIDYHSPPSYRYFAFNSITALFRKDWNQVTPQLKKLFPFHPPEDITDNLFCSMASKSVASYLAYAGSENEIHTFVQSYNPAYFKYYSSFITQFIIFLFDDSYPFKRKEILSNFIFANIISFTKTLLLDPILEFPPNSPDFLFLIDNVAAIHEFAPILVQLFIRTPDSEFFYSYLAQFVWSPSIHGSLLTIFEVLFENFCNLPITVQHLASSLQNSIKIEYIPLFSFDTISESEIEHHYFLFNNLFVRISLIANILSSASSDLYGPFFDALALLFRSCSPSIIYEAATQLQLFLKSLSPAAIPLFLENYESHLRSIFESSLPLLQAFFDSSPAVVYDHRWTQHSVRGAIMDLTRCIIETFDDLNLVSELLQLIPIDGAESNSFNPIVRILINVLSDPNEKLRQNISQDAFNCTIFLLSSLNKYLSQVQNHICKLLIKLIPFLDLDDDNVLDQFFNQLLSMFIDNRPIAFDPFTNYFNQFTNTFGSRIKFPIELLKTVPKSSPCYHTVNNLLAKYSHQSEDSIVLSNALTELQWFTSQFKANDSVGFKRVRTKLARQFEILSQIQLSENVNSGNSIYDKIGFYLIKSNQVLNDAGDNPAGGIPLGQFVTLLTQFAPAIAHFSLIAPNVYIQNLPILNPPTVVNQAFPQWISRIAFPIVTALIESEHQNVYEFVEKIITKMYQFVSQAVESPAMNESDFVGIVKKLIISICDFCQYTNDELAIEALRVCLKYDNYKTYFAVAHAVELKGINVLSALWPILITKRDNQSIDKLSELLLNLYEKSDHSMKVFEKLPNISGETLEMLNSKLPNSTAQKTRKRIIRSFLIGHQE